MEHLWWLLLRRIFSNIIRWGNLKVRIWFNYLHKQPFRGVLKKSCSENMQQIYRRTPTPKCDLQSNFIEITLRHGCSPVNLLHIFRTPFLKGGCLCISLLTFTSHNSSEVSSYKFRWTFRTIYGNLVPITCCFS